MNKFSLDAQLERVLRAFLDPGFVLVRRGNHLSLARQEADGTQTPLTLPGHRTIKGSTLRAALSQTGVAREDFLRAYERT